jgi:epoxyqueuosine reductase
LRRPRLADLARLDDAAFRQLFSKSPVKRIGRDRFVRNVLYAIGNSGDPALAEVAIERLDDASDVVRDAAQWALVRLSPPLRSGGGGPPKAVEGAAASDPLSWEAAQA